MKHYAYYQWVFIVLFLQAVSFYIPRFIWKSWEGGRIQALAGGLADPVLSKDCIRENTKPLVDYFSMQLHSHNGYAYKYLFCDVLYLANTVTQIYCMNRLFGEDFLFYGINVVFHQKFGGKVVNPMEKVFPTITKCVYEKYGPSGSLENRDGICVLPQNTVNSKIYVFLWFWLYILAFVSVLQIIYHLVCLFVPWFRLHRFRSSTSLNSARDVKVVFHKLWVGDWFLLHMLQQNMNPLAYKELISQIAGTENSKTMSFSMCNLPGLEV